MAKIIYNRDYENVVCQACGCEYQYQYGDKLYPVFIGEVSRNAKGDLDFDECVVMLECPICSTKNKIKHK